MKYKWGAEDRPELGDLRKEIFQDRKESLIWETRIDIGKDLI